jgi:transcription initiation factor IIF auxiliary subunit
VPSWGSFEIEVTIFWTTKTGQQIPFSVNHDLVFETRGASKVYKVKFDNTKLAPLVDPPKAVAPKKTGAASK